MSKKQIEMLLGLLNAERSLTKPMTLYEVAQCSGLDYHSCLYRNYAWLVDNEILVKKDNKWLVDYDAIAELLFNNSEFHLVYKFAYRHLEYSL